MYSTSIVLTTDIVFPYQLLGRAAIVGDFVKRGEDSGWIRITLQGRIFGDLTSITCTINKPNKCTWVLKGMTIVSGAQCFSIWWMEMVLVDPLEAEAYGSISLHCRK